MSTSNLPPSKYQIFHGYFRLSTVQREASALATHQYFKQYRKAQRRVKPSTGLNLRNIFRIHALVRSVTMRNVKKKKKKEKKYRGIEESSPSPFLIASGIIGTLLGSLHQLPACQKTTPTALFHSCARLWKKISLSFGRQAFARSDDKGSWYLTLATYPTMAFKNTAFNYSELAQ